MSRVMTSRSTRMLGRNHVKQWKSQLEAWLECRNIAARNPIVVYQMGKVGSSTVLGYLRSSPVNRPVLHCHTLVLENWLRAAKRTLAAPNKSLPKHLQVSKRLIEARSHGDFRADYITIVREPIARAVSFVFEDWRKQAPDALDHGRLDPMVMQARIKELLTENEAMADPTSWFKHEIETSLGIDVFSETFNFERAFQLFRRSEFSLLVLRLEDFDAGLEAGLQALLGVDLGRVDPIPANQSSSKWYGKELQSVKNGLRLDGGTLDRILSSQFAKHFYADRLDQIRTRWAS